MELMVVSGIILLFVIFLYGETLFGIKCPVCHSTRHWDNFNEKHGRYFDDLYCFQCQRAIYVTKTGKFKVFDRQQGWKS